MLALQAARRRGCARPDRPSWSGIVIRADAFVLQFAQHMGLRSRMRRTLFASLDMAAKEAEEEARGIISAGVQHFLAIGEEHLPAGVKCPHRVFRRTYCRSQRAVRKAATRSHLVPISLIKTATSATASWKRRHNIPMSQSALRSSPRAVRLILTKLHVHVHLYTRNVRRTAPWMCDVCECSRKDKVTVKVDGAQFCDAWAGEGIR